MRTFLTAIILNSLSLSLLAQQSGMEEFMYRSGKINVVIAVVFAILLLLFIYLFRLDKKIKNLEDGES